MEENTLYSFDNNDPITHKFFEFLSELGFGDNAGASGDYRKAVFHLKNAVAIAENEKFENLLNSSLPIQIMSREKLSKSYFLLGNAYQSLQEFENAIDSYNKAVQLEPYNEQFLLHRGICKGYIGKFIDAIIDFDMAISRNPTDFQSFKFRGLAKLENRDRYNAKSDLEKARDLGCPDSQSLLKEIFG